MVYTMKIACGYIVNVVFKRVGGIYHRAIISKQVMLCIVCGILRILIAHEFGAAQGPGSECDVVVVVYVKTCMRHAGDVIRHFEGHSTVVIIVFNTSFQRLHLGRCGGYFILFTQFFRS